MKATRLGSTRIITAAERGELKWKYTGQWSAFDRGASPQLIPSLGASRCKCAVRSFNLAKAANVPTHFVRQVDDVTIHVREFEVPGQPLLSGASMGRVLPIEIIDRFRAAGSLLRRLRDGTVTPESLGFPKGTEVTEGMTLPRPVMECTTKFEPVDRHLTNEEAQRLAGLDDDQWIEMWNLVVRVNNILDAGFTRAGFLRLDGKKEIGLTHRGEMVMVDVFGTQDEDRIIHTQTGNLHCKDLIRNYLESLPWYQLLVQAKKEYPNDKSKWPPYPALPDWLTELVSERYAQVADSY